MSGENNSRTDAERALEAVTTIGAALAWFGEPMLGAAMTFAGTGISHLLGRRFQTFVGEIRERLERLEEQGLVSLKTLARDEAFVTDLLTALRLATQTHREEKREALRNGVLNAAMQRCPDEEQRTMFFRMIDELGISHLRVLRFLQDPAGVVSDEQKTAARSDVAGLGPEEFVMNSLPELADRELVSQIILELRNRGLLRPDYPGAGSRASLGMYLKRWTMPFGDRFLDFVTEPAQGAQRAQEGRTDDGQHHAT